MFNRDDKPSNKNALDELIRRHMGAFVELHSKRTTDSTRFELHARSAILHYIPKTRHEAIKKIVYFAALSIKSTNYLDDNELRHIRLSVSKFRD